MAHCRRHGGMDGSGVVCRLHYSHSCRSSILESLEDSTADLISETQNHRRADSSHSIRRRLDSLVAQINLGLTTVMGHVNIHRQQDFAAKQVSVRGVVPLAEFVFG